MPRDIPPERMAAWRAFLVAHARITETLATELEAEQHLPLTWYDVLVQLEEAPGHQLRMQELAHAVLLSKSGLTRLVDRMAGARLVRREPCPDDRRGTFVVLTHAGLDRLHEAATTHIRGVGEHFTDHLRDDEALLLSNVLNRIVDAGRLTAAAR